MTKKKYILSILVLVAFLAISFVFKELWNTMYTARHDTLLSCAQHAISLYLYQYYEDNGKYPSDLSELSDIGIAKDALHSLGVSDHKDFLAKFVNYKATDDSYELSMDFPYGSVVKTEKEFGEKGRDIVSEYYTNGKLNERIESPNDVLMVNKNYRDGKLVLETVYDSNMNIISQKEYK